MPSPYSAPKDWQPTSDQRQQIQNDVRLQRMSRDDLYMYFNNRQGGSTGTGYIAPQPASTPRPQRKAPPATSGGIFGWVDSVRRALGGD